MSNHRVNWLFILNNRGEADGGGKEGEEGNKDAEDMVSKVDLDAALAKSDKLEKDLEDVRMEVLTPDYQEFLDAKNKSDIGDDADKKKEIPDEDFEKMSKRDLLNLATKTALEQMHGLHTKELETQKSNSDAKTKREIAAFAKDHDDYATFRPTMYGLSLDPKYADLGLQQLYTAAKEHVARIHHEPNADEKAKLVRLASEKPGGHSDSLESNKSKSNEQLANDAYNEVEKELGPIPSG